MYVLRLIVINRLILEFYIWAEILCKKENYRKFEQINFILTIRWDKWLILVGRAFLTFL